MLYDTVDEVQRLVRIGQAPFWSDIDGFNHPFDAKQHDNTSLQTERKGAERKALQKLGCKVHMRKPAKRRTAQQFDHKHGDRLPPTEFQQLTRQEQEPRVTDDAPPSDAESARTKGDQPGKSDRIKVRRRLEACRATFPEAPSQILISLFAIRSDTARISLHSLARLLHMVWRIYLVVHLCL